MVDDDADEGVGVSGVEAVVVVDSRRRSLVWRGVWVVLVDGRVGDLKKRRCWMGFDVAQQGVMSRGWAFKLASAERRGSGCEGSIFRRWLGEAQKCVCVR